MKTTQDPWCLFLNWLMIILCCGSVGALTYRTVTQYLSEQTPVEQKTNLTTAKQATPQKNPMTPTKANE